MTRGKKIKKEISWREWGDWEVMKTVKKVESEMKRRSKMEWHCWVEKSEGKIESRNPETQIPQSNHQ